jgi:hypothetical protein
MLAKGLWVLRDRKLFLFPTSMKRKGGYPLLKSPINGMTDHP